MHRLRTLLLWLHPAAHIHVSASQMHHTGFASPSAGAGQSIQQEVSQALKDDAERAAFHQFRLFLEFQEQRELLSKCSCGPLETRDAVITASGDVGEYTQKKETPQPALAPQVHKPLPSELHAEASKGYSELQHTLYIKKGHSTSQESLEFNITDQAGLSQRKGSSSQAESPSIWHHGSLASEHWHVRHWSTLFNEDAPSWVWWFMFFRSWTFDQYLVWVPLLIFLLTLMYYPRTAFILLWMFIKNTVQLIFDFVSHESMHESEEEESDIHDDVLIQRNGICPPATMLWQTSWWDLTDGKKYVLAQLGINDAKTWDRRLQKRESWSEEEAKLFARSTQDWDHLHFSDKSLLSKIGFSRESWRGQAQEMRIHEKRWIKLTRGEKHTVTKLEADMDEYKWNNRTAKLFRTPWAELQTSDNYEVLIGLGWEARYWKPYRDPKFEPSGPAKVVAFVFGVIEEVRYSSRMLTTTLLLLWVLFLVWKFRLIQFVLNQAGSFFFLALAILATMSVTFAELYTIMQTLHNEVVTKVRYLHVIISNFWDAWQEVMDLPHNLVELLNDVAMVVKLYKENCGKVCKGPCSSSCVPCKTCKGLCCPSCLPWKA